MKYFIRQRHIHLFRISPKACGNKNHQEKRKENSNFANISNINNSSRGDMLIIKVAGAKSNERCTYTVNKLNRR